MSEYDLPKDDVRVYILEGSEPYESPYILGIFSTEEKAEQARDQFKKTNKHNRHYCKIKIKYRSTTLDKLDLNPFELQWKEK